MILKQGVPYNRTFLMVSNTDHVTGKTGLGTGVTMVCSKNGLGFNSTINSSVEIANGWYYVQLTGTETSTIGDLAFHMTGTGADPTDFADQVQSQVFSDLAIQGGTGTSRILIADNIQQNANLNGFQFLMISSTTGSPLPGLGTGITAQRSLAGAGFSPCVNTPTELANGVYTINLAAADLNSPSVMLRFSATGAADLDILLITTP
jgi:hypothetical protein